jgi:hypothetical protein
MRDQIAASSAATRNRNRRSAAIGARRRVSAIVGVDVVVPG